MVTQKLAETNASGSLFHRISAAQRREAQALKEQPVVSDDLYSFTAEFFTEHRIVQAELRSPEIRLSDHLNSTTATVDLRPSYVAKAHEAGHVDLGGLHGHLIKGRLLFVVPITEPDRPRGADNVAWKRTTAHMCWAGVGAYSIAGKIHTEAGVDPRMAQRLLDRRFLPLTEATMTFPDGSARACATVIVNCTHLDLLAVQGSP